MKNYDYRIPETVKFGQTLNAAETSGSSPPEQIHLDTREAAAFLKISVGTLRNKSSNGQIPYYKLGGKNLYKKSELLELLSRNPRGVRHGH